MDLLALSGDITQTWSSPIYPKLYSNDSSVNPLGRPITIVEDSWLASLVNVGALLGPIFGLVSERRGRKAALLCMAVPHIISYVTMAFAKSIYLFYFGRILGGIALGGGYTILPMYLAEVAEDSNRGMYSVTLGIFWSIGNFIPYAVGPFLDIMSFHLILAFFPLLFFIVFALIGVETPYYLVGASKIEEAEKVLMKLRSATNKEIQNELKIIKDTLENEGDEGRLKDIFIEPSLRKAFFISIMLVSFQQFSGWNSITFYLQPIFEASGSTISSDISSLIIGTSVIVFSLIIPFFVDRFGRKPLLTFSGFSMAVSICIMGIYFYLKENTNKGVENLYWLPLFSLMLYLFMYGMGMSVIPWTISSELFPKNVKSISSSTASTVCWIGSFITTYFFNDLIDGLGRAGTFWMYTGICISSGIFTIFFVPETKGKSFMEIQNMLKRRLSFIKK